VTLPARPDAVDHIEILKTKELSFLLGPLHFSNETAKLLVSTIEPREVSVVHRAVFAHDRHVHGRADEHLSTRWVAANLIVRRRERVKIGPP